MNEILVDTYEDTILQSLLKANDVAEILNISRAKAYRLMQSREIPTVSIGKAKRVRPVDLHNFIHSQISPSSS